MTIAVSFYIFQFPIDTNNTLCDCLFCLCSVPSNNQPTVEDIQRKSIHGRIQFQSTDKSKLVICSIAQCYIHDDDAFCNTHIQTPTHNTPEPPEMGSILLPFYYQRKTAVLLRLYCDIIWGSLYPLPDSMIIGIDALTLLPI